MNKQLQKVELFVGMVKCNVIGLEYPDYTENIIGISDTREGCKKLLKEFKDIIVDDYGRTNIIENTDRRLEIKDGSVYTNYYFSIKSCELNSLFDWLV